MADQTLSAGEAAERLGVSYSTLKGLLDRIPLGLRRNDRGEYSIDQAALDLLASVRDWRADGSGINTITKRIRPFNAEPATEGSSAADEPSPDHGRTMDEPATQTAGVVPVAELLPVIQEVSRLTMALSEASYRQGQLEEQVRQLTAQADQTATMLSDGQASLLQAQDRASRAEGEAQALRQQLTSLQAQATRPWWRRWLGIAVAVSIGTAVVSSPAMAADRKGQYNTFGVADDAGAKYGWILASRFDDLSDSDVVKRLTYTGWLAGYLNAVNLYEADTYDILGNGSFNAATTWIGQYGQDHPQDALVSAVRAYVLHMKPKRLRSHR